MTTIQTLTAETPAGREAIQTVMAYAYSADIDNVPPRWAWARVAAGVPVAFILVDPRRGLAFPDGDLPYAYISDVAVRSDRRGEGHFRALMDEAFKVLKQAGLTAVITHGRHQLYRRFGFEVFTHHRGIFITPDQIAHYLGDGAVEDGLAYLTVDVHPGFK